MSTLPSSSPVATALSVELLIQAVQDVSTATTLDEIIDVVNRAARAGTGADGVSFVLREDDQCFYVREDSIAPLWQGRRFPINECISGWTMLHRQAVAIPDVTADLRIPQDAYRPTFVRSLVMVPIRSQAPLGALGAYWAREHLANPATVHWLQALADATSAGIEAVRATREAAHLRRSGSNPPTGEPVPGGTVRMCAWTKRILYNGRWVPFEVFLRLRYGIEVTHGMSEDALTRLMQEMAATSVAAAPGPKA